MPAGYVIRIPKKKDRLRAIEALMKVKETRHVFTEHRWLVTEEHIEALKREGIPYEDVTDLPWDMVTKNSKRAKSRSSS